MANTWCFKVFRLCFLIMCVFQNIDYTRADDHLVNYGQMNYLIKNARSVSLNENTIHLDTWLPRIFQENKVNEEINLIIMYTFVKCECAHLIGNILANKSKPISSISQLYSLNTEIKRAITVLFYISDFYRSLLKSGEPYFLKTLLITGFYIDGLPNGPLDDTVNRTLLQIINLFERFTVGYCPVGQDGNDNRDFEVRLLVLNNFLNSIANLHTDPPHLIDMSDIKLERCMLWSQNIRAYENIKLASFCKDILRSALNRNDYRYIFRVMYKDIQFSYDIKPIYDYMHEVYNAILTLLYLVTSRVWNNGNSLNVEWCNDKISELKSRNFPIEMINNFELALRVEHHKNNLRSASFKEIFRLRTRYDTNFGILEEDIMKKLTLSDLMDIILDEKLTLFWWVFNSMHKVFEKKSVLIDVTVLNKFPPITYDIKCDELAIIYRQSIRIEKTNKACIEKNSTRCSKTVCSLVLKFLDILLEQMNKWNFKENYTDYDNLGWMTLAAISNLNKWNKCKSDKHQVIINKQKSLKRTLDVFINALDYHQITKCEVIINRESVTEVVQDISQPVEPDSYANPKKISTVNSAKRSFSRCFSSILEDKSKEIPMCNYGLKILTAEDSIIKSEFLAKILYFNWHTEVKSIYDIQRYISDNMLDLHDLVEYQKLYLKQTIYIYYNMWLKIVYRIFLPTDRDLIKLQKEYEKSSDLRKYLLNDEFQEEFNLALEKLFKIIITIFQSPINYQVFESKIIFYKQLVIYGMVTYERNQVIELLEEEIINPTIRLLGVVEKDEEISGIKIDNIQEFMGINGSMDDFEKLFAFMERNNFKTIRDFIYGFSKTA